MLTFTLNPEIAADGWTQSEITLLDTCGKQWFWRYHELLRLKGDFSWPLVIGSAFHSTLEQMYATRGARWSVPPFAYPSGTVLTASQQAKELYWAHVLNAMCTAYSQYHHADFEKFVVEQIEEKVEVEFMGFIFRGMIDLRFRPNEKDGLYIMDHKTASRLNMDTVAAWDFRFQFMFYLWLKYRQAIQNNETSQLRGYYINGVKKPELKQKVNEPIEAFAERCRVDMVMEPQKYFYREKLIMTVAAMENFERNVLMPKITRLQLISGQFGENPIEASELASSVAHNMNTDACQKYGKPCEFIQLCRFGSDSLFQYTRRDAKHEELEDEG